MKYNMGKFKHRLELLCPGEFVRDDMGGIMDRTYKKVGIINAFKRDKSVTFKTVIGDYVTTDTVYFVVRDIRSAYNLDTDWRLIVDGYTYIINTVTLLDDTVPKYLEIEATKIGGIS